MRVKLKIDKERRLQLMRMHTATHILLRACKNVLGFHVWQQGSHLHEELSRLDISHYKNISDNEINEIENISNEIVLENRKVKIFYMNRTEAEQKFGFEIYQGGIVPGKIIRLVEIENFDIQACGGLHVNQTGEIGLIKIISITKIQDGIYRILYTAGKSSLEYFRKYKSLINEVCKIFSTQEENIVKVSKRFFEEWKERGKKIEKLLKIIANVINSGKIYEIEGLTQEDIIKILTSTPETNILIVSDNNILGIKSEEIKNLEIIKDKKGFKKENIFIGKLSQEEINEVKKWFKQKCC